MTSLRARILLVDDEPRILETSREILLQEGYDVDAVADGYSALEAIAHTSYDLVLTDLKMDGMDGLALLSEVQKQSPQTVTVMMTGYGTIDSATEAVRRGAYEFLLKPVAVEHLKHTVVRCLERKRFSEIDALYHVGNELALAQTPDAVQTVVVEAACRVLGASNVMWFPADRDGMLQTPSSHASYFTAANLVRLAAQEVVIRSGDSDGDDAASAALVPGFANGKLMGVLYVDHGANSFEYHASAQRFLCGLAGHAALALDRLALIEELRQNNSTLATANRRLQELDVLKSQFLSVATHELRTPLSIILGYNSMIEESAEQRLTIEERGLLRESLAACKRLMRLVNSMLDLSQMQAGKMRLQFTSFDLAQSLQSVTRLFEAEAQRRGLNLELHIDGTLPPIEVDPERVEQVFVNLVSNALKYTDSDGVVSISARVDEASRVEVCVSDTGIGIAPEHQAMIFDEFARVRNKPGGRPGSGLGLAIVRRIVEAHGGEISVNSTPGQGSSFTVCLPVRQRAQNAMVA
jgi:signal transduction histidine kinase/DNA-binding response OmpR family regulator